MIIRELVNDHDRDGRRAGPIGPVSRFETRASSGADQTFDLNYSVPADRTRWRLEHRL